MKRGFMLVSLLLPGLMLGCARNTALHALQVDTAVIQRQSRAHHQTVETRLQQLSDRVAQFEQAQAATRRDVARAAATVDELRDQLRHLQGTMQETQHQVQQGPTGEGRGSAPQLAHVETRLRALEKQLRTSP